jgi:hypothetical protein
MGLCSSSSISTPSVQPISQDDGWATSLRTETKRVMSIVKPRLEQALSEFKQNKKKKELSFDRIVNHDEQKKLSTKQRKQQKTRDKKVFTDKHILALVGSDQLNSPLINGLISINDNNNNNDDNNLLQDEKESIQPIFVKMIDPTSKQAYYYCELTGETQWEMPKNFVEVQPITTLSICDHQITDEGCPTISNLLNWSHRCLSLTILRLRENNITDHGAECLAEALFSPTCTLTTLDLHGNSIGDQGIQALASSITNGRLLNLSLDRQQNVRISELGIEALSDALLKRDHCKLQKLSLSGNKSINDECATLLSESIQNHSNTTSCSLKELYLSGTSITDNGAISLSKCIHLLTNLSLSGCRVKDRGGTSIADALKTAHCMRGLDIQGNSFQPNTVQLLIDSSLDDCLVSVSLQSGKSYSS